MLDSLRLDLAACLRRWRRRPSQPLATAATLAIVVGLGTAVFAVVNATLLRPLPFPDQGRLVQLFAMPPGTSQARQRNPLHALDLVRFRERARSVDRIEALWPRERGLAGTQEPAIVKTGAVSAGFFDLLGGRPRLGRVFTPEEDLQGRPLAILGFGLWQRLFGGDEHVLGRSLLLDGEPHVVVGVMSAGFQPLIAETELWTPLGIHAGNLPFPAATYLVSVAHLARGRSPGEARAELLALMTRLEEEDSGHRGWRADVASLRDAQFGDRRPALLVLLAMAALLLCVAGANIANVTLAEMLGRKAEFALRAGLGASRAALLRLVLVESLLVCALGTAAGVLLARLGLPLALALDPQGTRALGAITLDWRVFAFAALAGLLCACASGVWPAQAVLARPATGVAQAGRRALGSLRARRLRGAFLAAQTALTLVLLVGGGALLRGFSQAARVPSGFDARQVQAAQLRFSSRYATPAQRIQFLERLLESLARQPGISSAASVNNLFQPGFTYVTAFEVENLPTPDGQMRIANFRRVTPGYFATLRIPLRGGRDFAAADQLTTPWVAIVSESLAGQLWPGQAALGRRLKRNAPESQWMTVVGVAADVRDVSLTQAAEPTLYIPYSQNSPATAPLGIVVRSQADAAATTRAMRLAVASLDATQALDRFLPMADFVRASLDPDRFRTVLLALFATTALLLGIVGLYGLTARSVVERTREVAVHLALGARPRDVWLGVTWQALQSVGLGLAVGASLAYALGLALSTLLVGVQKPSWDVWLAATGVLAVVSSCAALLPARRAVRIDPAVALRAE